MIEVKPQILAIHTMQGRCSTMPLGWTRTANQGQGRVAGAVDRGMSGLVLVGYSGLAEEEEGSKDSSKQDSRERPWVSYAPSVV